MKISKLIVPFVGICVLSPLLADNIPLEGGQVQTSQQPQNNVVQQAPPVMQLPQTGLVVSSAAETDSDTSLSAKQRLARLEQQMKNYNQMNLPQKVVDLQQQLQKVQGQLAVQEHNIDLLKKQVQDYYQDLNRRLNNKKVPTPVTPVTPDKSKDKQNIFSLQQPANGAVGKAGDQGKVAYDAAFSLLAQQDFQQAASKMKGYLVKYPNGQYAVNAHYWLGELYYRQLKFAEASGEFSSVINNYPNSGKVADAKYKLAMIHTAQGQQQQAQQEFMQVVKQYPSSSAANLSQQQLQK